MQLIITIITIIKSGKLHTHKLLKLSKIIIDNVFNMRRFVSMDNLNSQAKVSHKLNLVTGSLQVQINTFYTSRLELV